MARYPHCLVTEDTDIKNREEKYSGGRKDNMDYKQELQRFVDVARQMVDNSERHLAGQMKYMLCFSLAAWQAFINGLEFYEGIIQASEKESEKASDQETINKITPRPEDPIELEVVKWMEGKAQCMVSAGHGIEAIDIAFYTAGHFDLCPGSDTFQKILKAAANIVEL